MEKISRDEIMNYLNLVINSKVLQGEVTGQVWTGFVSSKYIHMPIFRDEKVMEQYITLIKDIESSIIELRKLLKRHESDNLNPSGAMFYIQIERSIQEIKVLFKDDSFDENMYYILLIKTYEDLKKDNPKEVKKLPIGVENALKGLEKTISEDTVPVNYTVYNEKENIFEIESICTQLQEEKITNLGNSAKLKKFVKTILGKKEVTQQDIKDTLNELNKIIRVVDVYSIIDIRNNLANAIFTTILQNYLLNCGLTPKEIDELDGDLFQISIQDYKYNSKPIEEHSQLQTDYMLKYLKYIDIDKLFLLYVYRNLKALDDVQLADQDMEMAVGEFIDKEDHIDIAIDYSFFLEFSKNAKRLAEGLLRNKMIPANTKIDLYDEENVSIGLDNVKELMQKFKGDVFVTPQLIDIVKNELYANIADERIVNAIISEITFSEDEIIILSATNPDNLKLFFENGIIDKKFIDKIVEKLGLDSDFSIEQILDDNDWSQSYKDIIREKRVLPNCIDFLKQAKNLEFIDESDIKTYYENGYIEIADLDEIDIDVDKFSDLITEEELLSTYKQYVNLLMQISNDSPEEEKIKLENIRIEKERKLALYKKYKLRDLSKDEQKENAETIILNYYSELNEDDVENHIIEALALMYKDGIVDFESILKSDEAFFKDVIIERMLKRGELSLVDTKKIRETVGIDDVKKIIEDALKDDSIDENQKYILVMNMFYALTPEDTKLRIKYLNYFKYFNYKGGVIETDGNDEIIPIDEDKTKPDSPPDPGIDYTKRGYPDNVKWIFFYSLDPDAQVKKYANGYVKFYLPKFQKEVIEKYYEVDSGTHKIKSLTYGVATHVMDKNRFAMNCDKIEDVCHDGLEVINENELRRINPKKDRVRHNTKSLDKNWLRAMAAKLNIDLKNDTRYTAQELQNLNETIQELEGMYIEL